MLQLPAPTMKKIFLQQHIKLLPHRPGYVPLSPESSLSKYAVRKELGELIDFGNFFRHISSLTRGRTGTVISLRQALDEYVYKMDRLPDEIWQELFPLLRDILSEEYGIYIDENETLTFPSSRPKQKSDPKLVYQALKENGRAMHLKDLAATLRQSGVNYSIDVLRAILIQDKNKFILTGRSTYGLKIWEKEGRYVGGTIKQLIIRALKESPVPLHTYEIAQYVMQHRPTNERSIGGIIDADTQGIFKKFGSGFIGLSDKKYKKEDINFKGVNRYVRHAIISLLAEKRRRRDWLIKTVSESYNLRPVQVEVLLERFIEKGKLVQKSGIIELKEQRKTVQ
jgi:hypothetical protein